MQYSYKNTKNCILITNAFQKTSDESNCKQKNMGR